MCVCVCVCTQFCLTLCDPVDCSLPGSSNHGIFQARILECVAFPPPGELPDPGIEPVSPASPALAGGFFTNVPPRKPVASVRDTKQRMKSLFLTFLVNKY